MNHPSSSSFASVQTSAVSHEIASLEQSELENVVLDVLYRAELLKKVNAGPAEADICWSGHMTI